MLRAAQNRALEPDSDLPDDVSLAETPTTVRCRAIRDRSLTVRSWPQGAEYLDRQQGAQLGPAGLPKLPVKLREADSPPAMHYLACAAF